MGPLHPLRNISCYHIFVKTSCTNGEISDHSLRATVQGTHGAGRFKRGFLGYPATFSERGYFQQLVKTGARGARGRAQRKRCEDGARSGRVDIHRIAIADPTRWIIAL